MTFDIEREGQGTIFCVMQKKKDPPADKHPNPTAPNKSTLSLRYTRIVRVTAGNGGFSRSPKTVCAR